MSENMQCHMNVKNTSGGTLTLNSSNLDWGKWGQNPPTQIANGAIGSFYAEGAKGTATGTQGSVIYYFSDNQTYLTINFDIPYTGANSGGLTLAGPGMSNYTAQETDDGYVNVVSFPSSGDSVTTYFAIGQATQGAAVKTFDFAASVRRRLSQPKGPVPSVDIVEAARRIGCGILSGPDLIKLYDGKTEATALEVLTKAPANLEKSDIIRFAAFAGTVPVQTAFTAAVDFANHVVHTLKPTPDAYGLALEIIEDLKTQSGGSGLTQLVDQLEGIKMLMLSSRTPLPNESQIAAIEAILACVYLDTGGALAQAASCAQVAVAGTPEEKTIVKWQYDYLLNALKA